MEVRVCTRCRADERTTNFDITIDCVKSDVWDLKKDMERRISVAACDQTVYYRGRLLENTIALKSLYYNRMDDCFMLEFPTTCEMGWLTMAIESLKTFVRRYKVFGAHPSVYVEGLCDMEQHHMVALEECYQSLIDSFESCSNTLFTPWNDNTSVANRHFFRQEGGLELISTIYKFTKEEYYVVPEAEDDLDDELTMTERLEGVQRTLEYMCLVALWNYSEMKEDRLMVLEKIGLEMFIHSLVAPEDVNNALNNSMYPYINESAVGCLAQYVEIPDIQLKLAANSEAVAKLVSLSLNATSLYHKEVAVNTLFCCSNHIEAATHLIRKKTHLLVVEKMQPIFTATDQDDLDGLSVAMRYFFCLFLANMRSLPEQDLLSEQEKRDIDAILEKFLTLHVPSEIASYEREHSFVWITLAPFVQLAFSATTSTPLEPSSAEAMDVPHSCWPSGVPGPLSQYSFSSAAKIGLFSLCHLTERNPNQEVFKTEKLVDYLVCACWFAKNCEEASSLVPDLTQVPKVDPPQLKSIANAYLAKCYGCRVIN